MLWQDEQTFITSSSLPRLAVVKAHRAERSLELSTVMVALRISNRAMSDINISPDNLVSVGFLLAETVSCRLSRRAYCPATRVCVKLTARSSDDLATLETCQEVPANVPAY